MESNELDTNSVRKYNMRVFRNGVIVVVIVCPLTMLIILFLFIGWVAGITASADGSIQPLTTEDKLRYILLFVGALLIAGAINAIIMYMIKRRFSKLNQKNIEISVAKKWFFYAVVFVVAVVVAPVSLFISLYTVGLRIFR